MRVFIVLILFLLSLSAVSKEFTIGVLYWSMNIEGQVIMRYGVEEEVRSINRKAVKDTDPTIKLIPFVAGDGVKGIKNQVEQFYRLVDKKVDLIIVQPADSAALLAPLLKANKDKIPVVAYDQFIVGGEIEAFITSNNYQAGFLDGEYISSRFNKEQEIKIVLVEYPNVSSTVHRLDGFLDALKKYVQQYKVVKTYTAVEPREGRIVGQQFLKDFPKKGTVDVIFTVNDGGGLPIVEMLSKAGRNEIIVATVDGDPVSVQNIREDNLTVIDSAQFCAELGRQSVKAAYKLLQGKPVAKKILVPTFPITKETLKLYTGWKSKVPKSFKKPWSPNAYWDNSFKESSD